MEGPRRPDAQEPPWPPPLPVPLARALAVSSGSRADPEDEDEGPRHRVGRLAWRAAQRHWWQILGLWATLSAALAALAYAKIPPTYESTAWLKVDPSVRSITAPAAAAGEGASSTLETQIQLITSPDVLDAAAHDPRVADLPRIKHSADPVDDLRKAVKVAPAAAKTQVILVSMVSESPLESAAIVTAVVDSYLHAIEGWTDGESRRKIETLKGMQRATVAARDRQREVLRKLYERHGDAAVNPKERDLISLEQLGQYKGRINQVAIERLKADSALRVAQERRRQVERAQASAPAGDALERQVMRAFRADPEVSKLQADLSRARSLLADSTRVARSEADAATRRHRESVQTLTGRYNDLYAARAPQLRAELGEARGPDEAEPAEVWQARLQVELLRTEEEELKRRLGEIEVEARAEGGEGLEVQWAKSDLAGSEVMLETIDKNLSQLDFEARGGARVSLVAPARPLGKPSSNRRLALMAAAPVLVMGLLLGLFTLIEARSARVADPEDFPRRVRLGVIGVVPPLPGTRTPRGARGARDERRRVEEFVQSLDHLRVALSAGPPGPRCLLITSACGGEGKTTLAAQLAARFANAGLATLLVDADLRRPSLGELLEVPEGPGLADVLAGTAEAEASMAVVGAGGGFHLLPAGTPGLDPSRLLQGPRLGEVLRRLRDAFDVVILDAPPVLAVPDALLLGRWADGTLLAVRHDTSRYPLVERAARRLASVGVTVLGAVVNGVRTVESAYGAYHYASYGRGADGLDDRGEGR